MWCGSGYKSSRMSIFTNIRLQIEIIWKFGVQKISSMYGNNSRFASMKRLSRLFSEILASIGIIKFKYWCADSVLIDNRNLFFNFDVFLYVTSWPLRCERRIIDFAHMDANIWERNHSGRSLRDFDDIIQIVTEVQLTWKTKNITNYYLYGKHFSDWYYDCSNTRIHITAFLIIHLKPGLSKLLTH